MWSTLFVALSLAASDGGPATAPAASAGAPDAGPERELSADELKEARVDCYGQNGPDSRPVAQGVWRVWMQDGQAAMIRGDVEAARDLLVRTLRRGGEPPEAVRSLMLVHQQMGMQDRFNGCGRLAGWLARHPPKGVKLAPPAPKGGTKAAAPARAGQPAP